MKKLLFTDLDGTLLDYYTYSCERVRSSVERLKSADISIIFCSSKTWREQEFYHKELVLDDPVIVENGGGIFFPDEKKSMGFDHGKMINLKGNQAIALGKTYDHVLKALEDCAQKFYPELKYYAKLGIDEISDITKLDRDSAKKAKTRDFSETVFNADLTSKKYLQFEQAIASLGFQCIPGSKFVTITDHNTDKGKAVELLIQMFRKKYGQVITFGVGDSLNDLSMLKVVDHPYLVQKPDKTWVEIQLNKLTKIAAVGPEGWNMMAKEIIID